jgi:hypothetical protein
MFDALGTVDREIDREGGSRRAPDDGRLLDLRVIEHGREILHWRERLRRSLGSPEAAPVVAHGVVLAAEARPHVVPDDRMEQPVVQEHDRSSGSALIGVDPSSRDVDQLAPGCGGRRRLRRPSRRGDRGQSDSKKQRG